MSTSAFRLVESRLNEPPPFGALKVPSSLTETWRLFRLAVAWRLLADDVDRIGDAWGALAGCDERQHQQHDGCESAEHGPSLDERVHEQNTRFPRAPA